MALVLPVFLLALFAVMDVSRLMFVQITLQHAMREGGRFGVTGGQLADPADPRSLQSRIASIRQVVKRSAVGVEVDPSRIVVSSLLGGAESAGAPGDTVTLALPHEFRFVTPLVGALFEEGRYRFTVSTTFRNEPFLPVAAAP